MTAPTRPDGALASPKPPQPVCVLGVQGVPLPRISEAQADTMCARGWARWVGRGSKRHLKMTVEVPERPRGRRTTQRIRNDGGVIIAPDFHLEHKPLLT